MYDFFIAFPLYMISGDHLSCVQISVLSYFGRENFHFVKATASALDLLDSINPLTCFTVLVSSFILYLFPLYGRFMPGLMKREKD